MILKNLVDHETEAKEEWRAGVVTRMRTSALNGAAQLCIFEQWCEPGRGAPTHLHAVEEVLTVLAGEAEVWLGDDKATLAAGQSLLVPAGRKHGLRNTGEATPHVLEMLAAPSFEAAFDDQSETARRWVPPDEVQACNRRG